MSRQICLTNEEHSTIIDLLYFSLGRYEVQTTQDVGNPNVDPNELILSLLTRFELANNCEDNLANCDDLLNCITITPTTTVERIKEIERVIGGSTGGAGSVNARSANGGENTSTTTTTEDCDLALHFGRISEFIDILNGNNVDFFEWLEANTNFIELLQVISSVTGLDEVSIDALAGFIAYIQELPIEVYQAGYTDELKDEIRCDLFCRTKESCELKIADFSDYFGEKATIGIPASLEQFIQWLQDFAQYGILTPRETVFATFNLQLSFLRFLDTQIQTIANGVMPRNASERLLLQLILTDTPDSDYELLCDECPTEWCAQFDLTSNAFSQYFNIGLNGQWQSGIGYQSTSALAFGDTYTGVEINFVLPMASYTEFRFAFTTNEIGTYDFGTTRADMRLSTLPSPAIFAEIAPINTLGEDTLFGFQTPSGGETLTFIYGIGFRFGNNTTGGSGYIRAITIKGTGVNPFPAELNCT